MTDLIGQFCVPFGGRYADKYHTVDPKVSLLHHLHQQELLELSVGDL